MTVPNQTNRTSATGSGSTGQEVPFSFPISDTSDLIVKKRLTATGLETELTETTNYTIAITGDTGGTLTTVTAIETTEQIHIVRNTPLTQTLDLEQGGSFNAENIEDALDKNTKLAIENSDALARTLIFPATDPTSSFDEMPNSIDRASKNLTFDSAGKPTASVSIETGSATFSTIGTNIAEAATATAVDTLLGLTSVNVINKGADPTGASDSLAAFVAADAALDSRGTLFVPAGNYVLSDTFAPTKAIKIKGDGWGSVIHNTGASYAVAFKDTAVDGSFDGWSIEDVTIQSAISGSHLVYLQQAHRGSMSNVFLGAGGTTGDGIYLAGVLLCTFKNVVISTANSGAYEYNPGSLAAPRHGINSAAYGGIACNANTFIGTVIESCTGNGVNWTSGNSCVFKGGTIEKNVTKGFYGSGSITGLSIENVYFEDNPSIDAWATTTGYLIGDDVYTGGLYYNCLADHTSGTFATDLAAGKWELIDSPEYAINLDGFISSSIRDCYGGNYSRILLEDCDNTSVVGGTFNLMEIDSDCVGTVVLGTQFAGVTNWFVNSGTGTYARNLWRGTVQWWSPDLVTAMGAADATPTVRGGFTFTSGGTTTITDFDDGYTGQEITILAGHTFTVTHGTNIFLKDETNWTMQSGDSLTLVQKADTFWYEIGRSHNTSSSMANTVCHDDAVVTYENEVLTY